MVKTLFFDDLFSKKSLKSMVLRTFNFWGFGGPNQKTTVFNVLFWKNALKSMVFVNFNF